MVTHINSCPELNPWQMFCDTPSLAPCVILMVTVIWYSFFSCFQPTGRALPKETLFPFQAECCLSTAATFSPLSIICSKHHFYKSSATIQTCRGHKYRCTIIEIVPPCSSCACPVPFPNLLFALFSLGYFPTMPAWTQNFKNSQKMINNSGWERERKRNHRESSEFELWWKCRIFLVLWKYFTAWLT